MNVQRLSAAAHVVADSPAPAAVAIPAPPGSGGAGPSIADTEQRAAARKAVLEAAAQSHGIDPQLPTFVQFRVDPHSHLVRIQIIDQHSGSVIRQIPQEEVARFMETWDAFVGALLDHQA